MSFFNAFDLSASGLVAQRIRMNTVSSNLANASTTRGPDGGPYRRIDPLFATAPLPGASTASFDAALGRELQAVQVRAVVRDLSAPRLVYDPKHPDADPKGYVKMPNVSVVEEMANMMTASRSYEANLLALQTARGMAQKALNLLGR